MIKYLRIITFKDIKSIFMCVLSVVPSFFVRARDIWLISERENDAKDNGYYLFKYIKEKTKRNEVYYVINKESPDYNKIRMYNSVIQFGSFKHYIYTLGCTYNISTQNSAGFPNSKIFHFLNTKKKLHSKFVFLQHGITHNKVEWLMNNHNNIDIFCCASSIEKEFVSSVLGYNNKTYLTGFCRFDGLNVGSGTNSIFFMPTWRSYLNDIDLCSDYNDRKKRFLDSYYYRVLNDYLTNINLVKYLENNNIFLYFYLHDNASEFTDTFKSISNNIIIASKDTYNIQELLNYCGYLITDYSSIAFDFAFMGKPLQYFQFDYESFRKNHYEKGYFDYCKDGFGTVTYTINESINEIMQAFDNNLSNEKFINRSHQFFSFHDKLNCSRVFKLLCNNE